MYRMKVFLSCLMLILSFQLRAQDFAVIEEMIHSGSEDEAISLLRENEDKNNVKYLNLLGEAYLRKGLYEEAGETFRRAEYLQEANSNSNKLELADTYSFIAVLHYTTGNNQLSLQYHFKALELRQSAGSKAGIAASTNDIGLVYSRSNPERALDYYKKALEDYLELYGQNDDRIVSAYVNIGIAESNLGNYPAAHRNFNQALEIRIALGRSTVQEAFVHSNIGVVLLREQRYDEALQEFDIALGIYRKNYGQKHPEIASTYYLLGNTFKSQGKYAEALYNYQQALIANIADFNVTDTYQNPDLDNYYSADVLLGTLYQKAQAFEDLHNSFSLKIKDLEMAYRTIGLCDSLIDKIRQFRTSESDKVELGELAADIYESAIRISVNMADISWKKQNYYEKAFEYSDKSKSAVLLEAIADANARSYAGIPEELLEQERVFKAQVAYYEQKLAGKLSPEEEVAYRKELFDWTKDYNDLISILEKLFPTYYNLKHNTTTPTVADISQKLNENEVMISYFVAEEDSIVYAFVITQDKLKVNQIRLKPNYDSNISGYRNAMYYDAPNTYKKTARELFKQLMDFKIPGNANKLIIIPSGRMATIPFESLITEDLKAQAISFKDIPYLINKYSISYFYSAGLYLNPKVEMMPEEAISLFAPVEFKGRRLSNLPGTKEEVNNIGNLFAGSSDKVALYLGDSATVSKIESDLVRQSKFLHFATHGIVDEKRPERSQICLAAIGDEEGSLFSGDIYGLNLSSDLVVLSACETGLGKISKGEGIIGLTRALIYAGSNNLLVSLWRVNDASTSTLMNDFYSNILAGQGYAEALRSAKLKMFSDQNYPSPYYWATFVLIGE